MSNEFLKSMNRKPLSVTVAQIRPIGEDAYYTVCVRRFGEIQSSSERPTREAAFLFARFATHYLVDPIETTPVYSDR